LSKESWLLSLDDSLFEAPFSALVMESGTRRRPSSDARRSPEASAEESSEASPEERSGGNVVYLIERHSVQVVPGAFSLEASAGAQPSRARMLALGDPVYNPADPRWATRAGWSPWVWSTNSWWVARPPPSYTLNRLPASGAEIRESARAWGDATILQGVSATRSAFLEAVADQPAVIHLATHVLIDPHQRDRAFVAFGLGKDAQPELLSTPEVASLRVPGSLIVMTGCSTGTGESAAGAGLLGLSRAWMVAGATGVVATGWPVEDRSGPLLAGFYHRLRSVNAAEALRRTQVEMLHSGTWQASPAYWAAYELSGGTR